MLLPIFRWKDSVVVDLQFLFWYGLKIKCFERLASPTRQGMEEGGTKTHIHVYYVAIFLYLYWFVCCRVTLAVLWSATWTDVHSLLGLPAGEYLAAPQEDTQVSTPGSLISTAGSRRIWPWTKWNTIPMFTNDYLSENWFFDVMSGIK